MIRNFELFVANRYLRAKRKQAVISVITVISIAGVAAGVMALVIALAITNGFRNSLQKNLLGATAQQPHLHSLAGRCRHDALLPIPHHANWTRPTSQLEWRRERDSRDIVGIEPDETGLHDLCIEAYDVDRRLP